MADESFTLKVNLDFTAATRQLKEFEKRARLNVGQASAAKVSGQGTAGAQGQPMSMLGSSFRSLARSVQTVTRTLDRLNRSLNATTKASGRNAAAAAVAGTAPGGNMTTAAMAAPGMMMFARAAVAPVTKVFSEAFRSIDLFNVQSRAEFGARQILKNSGYGEGAFDSVKARAKEIAGKTIYGDETLLAGASELSTFVADPEVLNRMMGLLADYAAGMTNNGELDSKQMTDLATGLGKAMFGQYQSLNMKGFDVDELKALDELEKNGGTVTDAMRLAALERSISSYRGLAEAFAETDEGKIIRAKGAMTDMREELGAKLQPILARFTQLLSDNMPVFQSFLDATEGVFRAVMEGATAYIGPLSWLAEQFLKLHRNTELVKFELSAAAAAAMAFVGVKLAGAIRNIAAELKAALGPAEGFRGSINAIGKTAAGSAALVVGFVWALEQIVRAIKASIDLFSAWAKESRYDTAVAARDRNFDEMQAARKKWNEAKGTADESGAFLSYQAAAQKYVASDYGDDRVKAALPQNVKEELHFSDAQGDDYYAELSKATGKNFVAPKTAGEIDISKSAKGSVSYYQNCGNTTQTVNNNINTDVKDISAIIREQLDTLLTSHLTVRSNLEGMKAVAL